MVTPNRKALQRHFDVSPKCRRCGRATSFDVAAAHPLRATLEHLYKAGDPRREETKGLPLVARTTLFCFGCNNADGARYGAIRATLRVHARQEAQALAAVIGAELLFGGYLKPEDFAKATAMLESRFASEEYLARIKKTVNETDRIEQETARIDKLLNAHRKWLHAQPGVSNVSVGVRGPAQIRLCVGGNLSTDVRHSIRDKIGDDVCFEDEVPVAATSPGQKALSR